MIFKKLKESKTIGVAVLATLCITFAMGALVVFAQKHTEDNAGDIVSEKENDESGYVGYDESALYKESFSNQEVIKGVCNKYGLDYDTVLLKEIKGEIFDYHYAFSLKEDYGSKSLYISEKDNGYAESLEAYIDDVHAFRGAKEIIAEVCKEANIDPEGAKIDDLTVEQIMRIDAKAFETSEHGN